LTNFNDLLLDFFNLGDSRAIFTLLQDSTNLVIDGVQLWVAGAVAQKKMEVEDCVELCCAHKAELLKDEIVFNIEANICPRYPNNTVHSLSLQA